MSDLNYDNFDGGDSPTFPDISALFQPRVVDRYMVHTPHPVQQIAMSLDNEELLFGGAAGGG